jgi:hypothetical protein
MRYVFSPIYAFGPELIVLFYFLKICTDHTAECDIRRPIEPLISNDTSLFRGVVHKRTRRIVLYNVRADEPYELVGGAVKSYAENKGVTIT